MSRIIPALNLNELSDDEMLGYSEDKIEALDGNVNFPILVPPLADMKTAHDDYNLKLAKAKNGTPADTAAKNVSRKTLEGIHTLIANDCALKSGTDLPKYLTSGYAAKRPPSPAGTLPPPADYRLKFGGNEGELDARCKPVVNNHGYEFCLGTDPANPDAWPIKKSSSSTKYTFTGLESGKKYYGRCRAIGARGTFGDWSDIAARTCP